MIKVGMSAKRLAAFSLWIVLWMSVPDNVSFSGKIYKWVDEGGTVGFADDLANIPEKYRKAAILEESETPSRPRERESPGQPEMPPSFEVPETDDAGHDRAYWQGRIKELQGQRTDLLERKVEFVQELDALNGRLENGIDPAKFLKLRRQYLEEIGKTKDGIKEMDHQLNDVLPEEARKANAPPGWLR